MKMITDALYPMLFSNLFNKVHGSLKIAIAMCFLVSQVALADYDLHCDHVNTMMIWEHGSDD